jgi:hypothetical protein
MSDELRYIEREAREQGEGDYYRMLVDEAYALYARVNKERSAHFPGQPRRVRLGKLRYRAWKRWERRKEAQP